MALSKEKYIRMQIYNEVKHICREGKTEAARRRVTDSIEALTAPQGSGGDIPVRYLPAVRPSRDIYKNLELRDSLREFIAKLPADELRVAELAVKGFEPAVIFSALGIPRATGYRRYRHVFALLKGVFNEVA